MMLRRLTVAALGAGVALTLLPAPLALADDPSAPPSSFDPTAPSSPWPSLGPPPSFAPAPLAVNPAPMPTVSPVALDTLATPSVRPPRAKLPLRKKHYGSMVARAQERLTWLGYPINEMNIEREAYGGSTENAVKAFQSKFWLKATGVIDKATWKALSKTSSPVGVLPLRCTEVKASICIDKSQKILRYVVKGKVKMSTDARFGAPGMETGEGTFAVTQKSYNHVSSLYHSWMPRAMFFNGDEAVHYSPDFASVGYIRGSHGCVGMRDMENATWLFNKVPVGTRVYVYWSP